MNAEKNFADGFRLTITQQTQWDAAAADMESVFSQLFVLDSLVQNGADPLTQESQRATLMQQALTDQSTMEGLYSSNLSARVASASAILQSLNSISPLTTWETNEKTLNSVFVNTAYVDLAPNATQTNQILQIAQQCSAVGGPAVFRARVWYHTLTGIIIEVNCNGMMERSADDGVKSIQPQLNISPNPAQNTLNVQLSSVLKATGRLEIFDIAGTLKLSVKMLEKSDHIEISTIELANGLYFCRLSENGQIISTAKFSVQH